MGYFFLSAFDLVKDDAADVHKIQIIMGRETDIPTKEKLGKRYEEKKVKEHIIKGMIDDIKKVGDNEEQIKKIKCTMPNYNYEKGLALPCGRKK